ncbi:MAG: hypothetical protein PHT33_06295, partial [bacterium]|nr:hypothetical protein [bacterium]
LFRCGQDRDLDRLNEITTEIFDILELFLSVLASGQHMDGAYDKVFARMAVAEFPLCLLPPYQGTNKTEFDAFIKSLSGKYPDWVLDALPI